MNSKSEIEMQFSLLFAIIAGAIILIIAIYAAISFATNSQQVQGSEASKQILNMFDPIVNYISTDFSPAPIKFNRETRLYLSCSESTRNSPYFGSQSLSFSEKSGFISQWTKPGLNISASNKYIFSEKIIQGKNLYLFSKPFYAGFKVDDFIILSFDDYCFINAPEFVKYRVTSNLLRNVNLSSNIAQCSKKSVKVCFGSTYSGCNISVIGNCNSDCDSELGEYDTGIISKDRINLPYFGSSLMFAGIFSSSEIYKCNVKRLGNKIAELSKIYSEKIGIISEKDCNSAIGIFLDQMSSLTLNMSYSKLDALRTYSKQMDEQNCDNSQCRIYLPEKCE